jgi:glycerol-3-phosphate dehydrogenase
MADKQEEYFNRNFFIKSLLQSDSYDIIVIGGGATGLGTALDAALRGFKTLLLEQSDFAKGTSSRSTKLVHGGVRYLAQGDVALVYEALRERGLLLENAPHLVKKQPFIIPCYSWFAKLKFLVGLKMYDWLAGKYSFGRSRLLGKDQLMQDMPMMKSEGLKGGIEYWDGQFDDARLAINIAQTCAEKGGTLLNYFKVTGLLKDNNGKVNGVKAFDIENKKEYQLKARVIINATGVFVDDILHMDNASKKPMVRPSQGVHVVLDQSFLKSYKAMMIPETADGRVLFAVPWHNYVLLGTTDTPLEKQSLEPVALNEEIDFILKTAGQYLIRQPSAKDVLSVYAGLRPLAAPDKDTNSTKEISRSHKLIVADSGLITITGGKWTTYRKMAEDTVDKAIKVGKLTMVPCSSKNMRIHGFTKNVSFNDLSVYGSDEEAIRNLTEEQPYLGEKIIEGHPYIKAEIVWAVRNEMARTVEDVLARRLRVLFLDADAAIKMSPVVASLMADELGFNADWITEQIIAFKELAEKYLLKPVLPALEKDLI